MYWNVIVSGGECGMQVLQLGPLFSPSEKQNIWLLQSSTNMLVQIGGPSEIKSVSNSAVRSREAEEKMHLHYLPSACQLVHESILYSRDHRGIVTLLNLVLSAHDYFSCLGVAEEKHLLRGEGNNKDGNIVV